MTHLAEVHETPQVSWSVGVILSHQIPRLLIPGNSIMLPEVVNFIKYHMLSLWKLGMVDERFTANGIA